MIKYSRLAIVIALASVLLWTSRATTTDTTFIARGATWKYFDHGTLPAANWTALAYDDSAWQPGAAELGYGDGDEATLVSYGPDATAKYITTYFRRAFTVPDPTLFQSLAITIRRDDGAVVYLNGTEVLRTNMPTGTVTDGTLATTALGGVDETTFVPFSVNPSVLRAGANVMAVEIHQANGTSTDISFDADVIASTNLQITRGPYLQMGTPSSVIVRWRTTGGSDSRVMYGLDPANLQWSAADGSQTTEHQVTVSSLTPGTKYYYAVGSTTQTLAGDSSHFFVTSPATGTAAPTRIWVLGDSGTADANAAAVRDAFYTVNGSPWTNLWLMLGDNAYESGLDSEFQSAVFNMYPQTLRQSVLWPTLGNHDGTAADSATGTGPYYDIFTLPKNGEAGGLPSGSEAYYSFDYGTIHFICLDSFETNRAANGPMMTWLQNDLAATTQKWIVAFFHHPPYSKGSHDSDTDQLMSEMRQIALPILEAGGADLVLSGHSHSYERSYLIDGHYGTSSTFTSSMKKNGGSGREDATGAYLKPTAGPAPHEGTVYGVAGSSGQIAGGALNHPAMFVSLNLLGSMILDVNGDRLDAKFLDNNRVVQDYFTIRKGAAVTPLSITTTTLPGGTVGTAYSRALAATGGKTPYSWSLASGALPGGLTLSAAGNISGTPNAAGTFPFTARVTDSSAPQQAVTKALSITIAASAPPAPGAFAKTAPKNAASKIGTPVALSWGASANASSYEYCYDTSNNSACNGTWTSTGTALNASVSGLARNATYYWEVRAVNTAGTVLANGGTWWKFMTAK